MDTNTNNPWPAAIKYYLMSIFAAYVISYLVFIPVGTFLHEQFGATVAPFWWDTIPRLILLLVVTYVAVKFAAGHVRANNSSADNNRVASLALYIYIVTYGLFLLWLITWTDGGIELSFLMDMAVIYFLVQFLIVGYFYKTWSKKYLTQS